MADVQRPVPRNPLKPYVRVIVLLPLLLILAGTCRKWIQGEWRAIQTGTAAPSRLVYKTGETMLDSLKALLEFLKPPDVRAFEMAYAFVETAVLYQVTRLGVLEVFSMNPTDAHYCLTCEEVCATRPAFGRHRDAACRLLAGAAQIGLLKYDERKSCYTITMVGDRFVRPAARGGMRELALWVDGDAVSPWFQGLTTYLEREESDKSPFALTHGDELWPFLEHHPQQREVFDAYMTSVATKLAPSIATALNGVLSMSRHVCDVGGGGGALVAAFMTRYPRLNATVFDLPEALLDGSLSSDPDLQVTQWVNRVAGSFMVKGDMKEKLGGSCDLLVMKHILHDWSDEDCVLILREIRETLLSYKPPDDAQGKEDGVGQKPRLVVLEGVMKGPESRGIMDFLIRSVDLSMLVMVHGGRERTLEEFESLFSKAGLRLVKRIQPSCPIDALVVEAV